MAKKVNKKDKKDLKLENSNIFIKKTKWFKLDCGIDVELEIMSAETNQKLNSCYKNLKGSDLDNALAKIYAGQIKGWKGLVIENQDIPFSVEVAENLMIKAEIFQRQILAIFMNINNFSTGDFALSDLLKN